MKKIIITGVFVALCIPAFAQETYFEGFYSPAALRANTEMQTRKTAKPAKSHKQASSWSCLSGLCAQISASLSAAVKPAETNEVEWVQAVRDQESNHVAGRSFTLAATNSAAKERALALKALVGNHRVIGTYAFAAPKPEQLAELTQTQFNLLSEFLQQPIDKTLFNVAYTPEVSHPQNGETQLTFNAEGKKLILLINSHPQRVYFFAGQVPQQKQTGAANKKTVADPRKDVTNGRVVNGHLGPSF